MTLARPDDRRAGDGGPGPAAPPKPIPPGQPGPDHPIELPQKPEPDPAKHV